MDPRTDLLGLYRHYKGNLYEVVGFAIHSETLEEMVVYKSLNGSLDFPKGTTWVRPLKMFFEVINVSEAKEPRFAKVIGQGQK